MKLEARPGDHSGVYNALWQNLQQRQPSLGQAIRSPIFVEWGHERPVPPPGGLDPDQKITRAENFILKRSGYEQVRADNSPDNHRLSSAGQLLSKLVLRRLSTPIKESILLLGFTDALYYCSPDGERAVRRTVYTQFLNGLNAHRGAEEVRVHV